MRSADWVFPLGSDTTPRFFGWLGAERLRRLLLLKLFKFIVIKAFQIYKTRREVEDKGIFEYLIFAYLIFEC